MKNSLVLACIRAFFDLQAQFTLNAIGKNLIDMETQEEIGSVPLITKTSLNQMQL